ncbi:MAG: hypothetical protein K2M13_06340 [Muribaculaceae bacterium]|nr:hypothetical protein [Muribaculaceae bacterium]
METKKPYWWITMSNNAHFRTLEVKYGLFEESETHNEKWANSIYFDNEEDAMAMLEKMKELIKSEYPRAKSNKWFEYKNQ